MSEIHVLTMTRPRFAMEMTGILSASFLTRTDIRQPASPQKRD